MEPSSKGRTPLFRRLLETFSLASVPAPAAEVSAAAADPRGRGIGRRDLLKLGTLAAAGAIAGPTLAGCAMESEPGRTRAKLSRVTLDVGIVGAGIAGLACAYELKRSGLSATLHDARDRVGGRIFSMGPSFAGPVDWLGQTIERGGELIDTPHKTMQGYIQEFGLAREDITKPARDTFYHFNGERIAESTLIDEYRVLVDAMRDDLRRVGAPTAASHTDDDVQLDRMSLAEWLDSRGAPSRIKALLRVAYTIEYGVEPEEMSCLAFVLFAKASRQSKMRLWGNFSDERFHVLGGNQQIPAALAARLPGQLRQGRKLRAVKKLSDGRMELTFDEAGRTVVARHDAVVLAIPFHLLREVSFDSSVALPAAKKDAIARVIYGNNAKLMVGFRGRPWVEQGSSGASYSDLSNLQATWETNPSLADDTRAVLTDYTGGNLAKALSPAKVQANCSAFLADLDTVYPGASSRARTSGSKYVCHLEHWPSQPLTRGAYTANQPGYFTTIAGNEATPVGNLYFAGETTDSFYSWQGFMEGGALSGLRAAGEIARDF